MSINHHPGEETLLHLASGTLRAGPALVISVHLEGCAMCRERVAGFEHLGGILLAAAQPVELEAGALERTLAQLDRVEAAQPIVRKPAAQHALGLELPRAMRHCEIGPWRWLGPGFRWSRVQLAGSPDAKIMFIKGKAGLPLPAHGHHGVEYMQILSGTLNDERGQFQAGDLDEADEEVDHRPIVGARSDCVCLAALDGDIRLHSLLGRLVRPLVGF